MSCLSLDLLCSVTKKALNCHGGYFQLAAIEMYNTQPQICPFGHYGFQQSGCGSKNPIHFLHRGTDF